MPEFEFRCIAVESNELLRPYLASLPGAPVDDWDAFVIHLFQPMSIDLGRDSLATMPIDIGFATARGPMDPDEELAETDARRLKERLSWILNDGVAIKHALPMDSVGFADLRFLGPVFTVSPYVDDILTDAGIVQDDQEILANGRAWVLAKDRALEVGPIPVVADDHAWRDWQREQADRVIPALPLFAHANRHRLQPQAAGAGWSQPEPGV